MQIASKNMVKKAYNPDANKTDSERTKNIFK